jgi:hypothetical protein
MRNWQNRDWAAVWVDRKKALVMRPNSHDDELQMVELHSDLESKHRSTGGRGKSKPFMHENGPFSAKHTERARDRQLGEYFDEIDAQLKGVHELLILGRGSSSVVFAKRWKEGDQLKVHFEKAEELTPLEFKKKALEFFGEEIPRKLVSAPGQALPLL